MKSKKQKILKYFSGQLENEQQFLEELISDNILKKEFDNVKQKLNTISITESIELNELYYLSLLPRAKEKLKKNKKVIYKRKIVYGFSTIIAAIITYFTVFDNFSESIQSTKIIDELLDEYEYSQILSVFNNENITTQFFPASDIISENDDLLGDYNYGSTIIYEQSNISSLYSNDYTENITDTEINSILTELEKKKYF